MSFPVYDYRTDVRNVLVTPQIRSRFLRMEPGQIAQLHSHDLGHEIFLVLEGRALFEIDGETAEVGPGQMCVALVDQAHSVRVVGDEPMTMYLSVTPHIQPTHTGRTPEGGRLPHRFSPNRAYDVADADASVEALIDRHVEAAQDAARAAEASARVQRDAAEGLKRALARGDQEAAAGTRRAMWEAVYEAYRKAYELAEAWNELAPRATEAKSA
jgi:quercetin dioxygenase-like cupin family protein